MIAPITSVLNSPSTSATNLRKEEEPMDESAAEKKEMPDNSEQQARCK